MRLPIAQIVAVLRERVACEVTGVMNENELAEQMCSGVSIDTRTLLPGEVFFALKGDTTDGHHFIAEAFAKGASLVIAASSTRTAQHPNQPMVYTTSPLTALQQLAAWHRGNALSKVLAVTGSNGKTTFKDALQRIFSRKSVFASPGSYNGELGLPLSILKADNSPELGIFEVGVAAPNEMNQLEAIVQPNFGVLINIGMAHIAAFGSREQIATEKLKLFANIPANGWVLVPSVLDEPLMQAALSLNCQVYQLGVGDNALQLQSLQSEGNSTRLQLSVNGNLSAEFQVKTASPEIITDIHFAASTAYLLGLSLTDISEALAGYEPSPTRMEVWSSPTGITVINDSHSADPISVGAALKAAASIAQNETHHVAGEDQSPRKLIFAFSGMRELGDDAIDCHHKVGLLAANYGFTHLYIVENEHPKLAKLKAPLDATIAGFQQELGSLSSSREVKMLDNQRLREQLLAELSSGDIVLYKGPRACAMTTAVNDLIGSISQRCMWIDLTAIKENIAQIRRHCGGVKVMAMLKALAYGTELERISYWAAHLGINAIGVSSASEGVSLRRTGYSDEIFVFLSDKNDIDEILYNNLTPILYSASLLQAFMQKVAHTNVQLNVHLKVDTGMHRLGVQPCDVITLAKRIRDHKNLNLTGVCTHLAAADDASHDAFTHQQLDCFDNVKADLIANGFIDLTYHAANSAAALRFKRARYDVIRPGLALYGIYTSSDVAQALPLSLAVGVTSHVIDIRSVQPNESIGYARDFRANSEVRLACVPFGYDDGLPWRLSHKGTSHGYVIISGYQLNIVGRISMDQILVDITKAPNVQIGDEVLIYGSQNGFVIRPEEVAEKAQMISHELLIRLGSRVQRIFKETS